MADVKDVGNIPLPATPDDRQVEYVLDGQQRMTSLFAAYRGAKIPRAGSKKVTDFADIYVNLDPTLPDDAQIVVHELPDGPHKCVSLKDVLSLNREVEKRLVASLGLTDDDLDIADKFKQAFATYDFSLVTLTREDIDSAIEVFTRINTGGSVLTLFEIMVAKTYDEEKKFDMQVEWLKVENDLEEVGYDGVSPSTILQLLALVLAGEAKRATILGLDKVKVMNITLIGADLNKRQINSKPPKVYIPKFQASNHAMGSTLATHLIDRQGMGIDEDDYGTFLETRAAKLWAKIDERFHPRLSSKAAP